MGLVYTATNRKNGKIYVGLTRRTLRARAAEHLESAQSGSTTAFHTAIRKHGATAFTWNVHYRSNDPSKLGLKERELIRELQSRHPDGYNLTEGGELGHNLVVGADGKIRSTHVGSGFSGWVQDFIRAIEDGSSAVRHYRRSVSALRRK